MYTVKAEKHNRGVGAYEIERGERCPQRRSSDDCVVFSLLRPCPTALDSQRISGSVLSRAFLLSPLPASSLLSSGFSLSTRKGSASLLHACDEAQETLLLLFTALCVCALCVCVVA